MSILSGGAPTTRTLTTVEGPRRHRTSQLRGRGVGAWAAAIIIALFVTIAVLPVVTIVLGSLKTTTQIVGEPLSFPNPIQFGNYIRGWAGVAVGESMSTYILNTILFSISAVAVSTIAGTMAAYVIARYQGRMPTFFERAFTILYALPYLAVIIPLFSITGDLGLRSNPLGIGLVFAAGWMPLTVVLMYGFFAGFPHDVIEAAKTDGASELRIFWTHVLPMSKGAILSCVLLAFIYAWNNLSHTLPLLVDPSSTTIAPGLLLFSAQYSVDLGAQFAGIVISLLPLIAAYALMHKHIMESFRVGSFR
ncbi:MULTISPECIES: carbohydrate ABC transporter permease [unclassified Microbacterium]|uniref:carbohydrate ABC transporter permease n=1 Tax=Microbacterium TaxID=33882 RepID=UPI003BA2D1CA